jgi:hypothetical protein
LLTIDSRCSVIALQEGNDKFVSFALLAFERYKKKKNLKIKKIGFYIEK